MHHRDLRPFDFTSVREERPPSDALSPWRDAAKVVAKEPIPTVIDEIDIVLVVVDRGSQKGFVPILIHRLYACHPLIAWHVRDVMQRLDVIPVERLNKRSPACEIQSALQAARKMYLRVVVKVRKSRRRGFER